MVDNLLLVFLAGLVGQTGMNPIGPATVPPSSYTEALISMPDPVREPLGNLVVAGSVSGGMHFRGQVPYGPWGDLRTGIGSGYLEGFLRYTEPSYGTGISPYRTSAATSRLEPGTSWPLLPGPISLEQAPPGLLEPYVVGKEALLVPMSAGGDLAVQTPDKAVVPGQVEARPGPAGVYVVPDPNAQDGLTRSSYECQTEELVRTRYEHFMKVAAAYMKTGRAWQAVDAYTMALVYNPSDTLAMAGKAHALLADGQYHTSGLFLARTLELCPDYLRIKVDLGELMGDTLAARLQALRRLVQEDGSPQLRLVLAYALYRLLDMDGAMEALRPLLDEGSGWPAAKAIYRAIGQINPPQSMGQ